MHPPRRVSHGHFVNITLRCEWKMLKGSPTSGYFRIDLPESFPLDANLIRFPIGKRDSQWQMVVDTCIDDSFY
jgi:hypothetical protein